MENDKTLCKYYDLRDDISPQYNKENKTKNNEIGDTLGLEKSQNILNTSSKIVL